MPLAELQLLEDLQVVHLQAHGPQVELQLARGFPKFIKGILIKKESNHAG